MYYKKFLTTEANQNARFANITIVEKENKSVGLAKEDALNQARWSGSWIDCC